ncbi:MAG: zf-TFIIB domain-containing protein [bacterium]|nr:zf-TFIIB domain-containing protein [bacterium]
MKCPVCDVDLSMAERSGIEIDFCPKCRGIWLDRGELDKIIEKSMVPAKPSSNQPSGYDRPRYDDDDDRYKHDSHHGDKHYRKRKGFLGELFDF